MPNICHALLIAASAEDVYRAITTPQGLSGWWTPGVQATPERDSIARFPFGPEYFKDMKITELTPPEHVAWTCIAGADEWVGTHLSFELHAADKDSLSNVYPEMRGQIQQLNSDRGTLVRFRHDDWRAQTPMFGECNYTWGQFLRSLKLLCETGTGRPWPHQHRTEPA